MSVAKPFGAEPFDNARLLEQLQAGQTAAQHELYWRSHGRLRAFFHPRLPSLGDMDIDDCVSEVITRALEGIRKGAQPQALIPWIMGIARHVVVEIYKNANHRGNSELSDLPEDYNPVENFVGSLVTQLDLQRVLEWVTQLPERQRKVISMVLEDYAPAEIAEYLGIRPSHVWREIYRARTAMRNARLPSNQRDAPPLTTGSISSSFTTRSSNCPHANARF
jgi:RNA polymerase sigma factor (sigma-70 family)